MKFFFVGDLGAGVDSFNSHYTVLSLDCLLSFGAYSGFVFYFALTT